MINQYPIITIDGPSGSGKGTICQLLAKELGFHLLDSGALYRLTALAASKANSDWEDIEAIVDIARNLKVKFVPAEKGIQVVLDNEDVSQAIRQEIIGMGASVVAAHQPVRDALLERQRNFCQSPGLVADGRDMGTTVFPEASVKIFLTASAEERAQRRYRQLLEKGESASLATIIEDIQARDLRDSSRSASPLKPASDAVVIDSSKLSIEDVFEQCLNHYISWKNS